MGSKDAIRFGHALAARTSCQPAHGRPSSGHLTPAATGEQPPALQAIVATNIAETSLTLEGVVYVIDSCFAKQRAYNPLTGLQSVLITPISRASSAQRAGRAGRVRPGHAFRLCTEAGWEALPAATVPEMQRCDLAGAVLQLKALVGRGSEILGQEREGPG